MTETQSSVVIGAVGMLLVGIIKEAITAAIAWRNSKKDSDTKARKDRLDEFTILFDRQGHELIETKKDVALLREAKDKTDDERAECAKERARAEDRIEYLEDLLISNKIPFQKRKLPGDTGKHHPLPPA